MTQKRIIRGRWDRKRSTVPELKAEDSKASTPFHAASNLNTQQQFKQECDLNVIVKNAQRGVPPRFLARGVPQWGDFSNVPDLTTAYNLIRDAEEAFMNLPSELRRELDNDPARLQTLSKEQALRFGLIKPGESEAEPSPSPAAPEAPSKSSKKQKAAPPQGTPSEEE